MLGLGLNPAGQAVRLGVEPGLVLDFAGARYALDGVHCASLMTTPGVVFTRAGPGLAQRENRSWNEFATGVPRITDKGLLIEETRTNLSLQSQALDVAPPWNRTGVEVTADAGLALNGAAKAERVVEDLSTGGHFLRQTSAKTAGATYTMSVFLKAAGRTRARLFFNTAFNTGGVAAVASLTDAGSVATSGHESVTAQVQAQNDGWYWCRMTAAAAADAESFIQYVFLMTGSDVTSYAGDGVSGLLAWGAQLEIGTFATSPITTAGAAATRGADVLTAGYSLVSGRDLCERGEVEFLGATGAAQTLLDIHDGTDANRVTVRRDAAGRLGAVVVVGGAETLIADMARAGARRVRWALARQGAVWTLVVDGTVAGSQTVGGLPTLNTRRIGARRDGTAVLNGYVREAHSVPWALDAARMQALTA